METTRDELTFGAVVPAEVRCSLLYSRIPAETANAVASREQVARILESGHFAKAERLKRFLRFVTEETLKGLSTEMKETVIGIEVFDRDAATYDPRLDPIVRVQAGRVSHRAVKASLMQHGSHLHPQ